MADIDTADEVAGETAGTVEFLGETFKLKDGGPSGYRLARFAVAVRRGDQGDMLNNVGAPLELVEACLADDEQGRFAALADKREATIDDIQHVVNQLFGVQTERPTVRPSDSSDGPSIIEPSSTPSAESSGSGRFDGRPDLRHGLRMAREAETAQAS